MEKGNYVSGEEVEAFEEEWARYCHAKYSVGVSSCTDALYIILSFYRERGNQIVQTTPLTFWATVEAVERAQMHTTLSDVDEEGCVKFPSVIDQPQGTVYLPVHLYGRPAEVPQKGLVVEDAAHAHGQPLRGSAQAFSFYPTKNLGAMGQAGAIVTNDRDLYQFAKQMRNHGENPRRFEHGYFSGNYRMDEVQAAILRVKLPHLAAWNIRRRIVADIYRGELQNLPFLKLPGDHPQHTYHIFGMNVIDPHKKFTRDGLFKFLATKGIQAGLRYPIPIHLQPAFASEYFLYHKGDFPHAEAFAEGIINLPVHEMMSEEDAHYIASEVRAWIESRA